MSGWDGRGFWSLAVHGLEAARVLPPNVTAIASQAIGVRPVHLP